MSKKVNGLVKAVASMSLAGGMLALAAGPAFAAAPNEAYAARATGLIKVTPLGLATSDGSSPVTLANINVAGLVTAGVVTDTADATSASSSIADVSATLTALVGLTASVVTSTCSFDTDTDTVSGSATVVGSVGTVLPIALDATADTAPNTQISVPGIATITLNRQVTAADGTLTVDAIYVNLLHSTQTLTLGTSICNDATLAPVSILPGMATPIGLGTLGLLALGGTAYYVSKRRRVTVTA